MGESVVRDPVEIQVLSLEEAKIHLAVHASSIRQLRLQVRRLEDFIDTYLDTPRWKRWWFRVNGWPGHGIVERPRWRPWHRWWRP